MLKRFKLRPCLLGVDINPSAIKILAVSYHKNQNQLCIEGYGYLPLVIDGSTISRDELISTLKTILARFYLPVKYAAIALPDSAVISKTMQIAKHLTALEAERFLLMEANKLFAGNSNVDFSIIGPNPNNFAMQDALLVAAKTEHVQKQLSLLQDVGLEVKIIAIESQVIAGVDDFIGSIDLVGEVLELGRFMQEIAEQKMFIVSSASRLTKSQKITISEFKKIAPPLMIALGLALRLANEH